MASYKLFELLKDLKEKGGSDLHLSAGSPPRMRIGGKLLSVGEKLLDAEEAKNMCLEKMESKTHQHFEETGEADFSFGVEGVARFRVNVYLEKSSTAGAFRILPWQVPTPEALKLPPKITELTEKKQGLILVTGATGSGKSSTIASLIELINQSRPDHIMTIEDPIEFVFNHKQSMVHQREVGTHTSDFKTALKYILRQDPDVVLIGEMRDLETIQAAITTAETGHLVFATLHTNTSVQTVDRIIDVFPASQQPQVRSQLSFILEAVLSQQLIPMKDGSRELALEMLFPNYAIRNLIREGKNHQIYSQMQTGQEETGMQTMNQCLFKMLKEGKIDAKLGRLYSPMAQEWDEMLGRKRA
ncbi:MAG: type IV pilus twitching motility protein PilT [Deltaproteobacteria bacterium]|nr:type IV pilus twitching motility protein PilT [Deltaproteobacteria bacterium]